MLLKDTERWQKLKRIFEEAAELDPAAAEAFLKTECAGDEDLLAKARRLLELHRQTGLALDRSPAGQSLQDLLLPRALEPGQLLAGRFRVGSFLGEGGIGEVYEAEDLELAQRLAIKTLHPFGAAEPSTRDRFKREITLARSVSHPNICRIHDFYAGEPAFITMELLEGEV
ncbi:MAG: protein kinase, partial [Saprospiraceae bacterium]